MNMNIEQLKAEVEAIKAANKSKLQAKVQEAMLRAQIALETNEDVLNSKALLAVRNEQTQKLQNLVNECQGIISSVAIFNPKSNENRIWLGKYRSLFGNQINLMYQLVSGILYSCQEHKELLLAHTGLNLELVEQTVNAFGTPSYYSRNYNTVIDSEPYDLAKVKATVDILQSELGVTVDTSELTEKNFQKEFLRAENNAQKAYQEAQEAIAEADFVL